MQRLRSWLGASAIWLALCTPLSMALVVDVLIARVSFQACCFWSAGIQQSRGIQGQGREDSEFIPALLRATVCQEEGQLKKRSMAVPRGPDGSMSRYLSYILSATRAVLGGQRAGGWVDLGVSATGDCPRDSHVFIMIVYAFTKV